MDIKIDLNVINIRPVSPFGININYLRDSDRNRPQARPIAETVRAAGMRFLRYPGGGKSDAVLHMVAPFKICMPKPLIKPYIDFSEQASMMDFDEFITTCRSSGCEPHIVVGCDTFERKKATMDEFLDNAVNWVRYSNVVKKYGVKRWEVGNENWNDKNIPPAEFGEIVVRFSKAMKEVDPSIMIGASGKGLDWWEDFLPVAAEHIDYLTVSEYPCWGYMRYDTYADSEKCDLLGEAKRAINSIDKYAPDHADRLFVAIVEFNSRDYMLDFENAGWSSANDLGHALANMDMCGQIALESRISHAMIWNTRWMRQSNQHEDIFYGLDANNGLMPSTMCLYVWGHFIRDDVLDAGSYDGMSVFAYKNADGITVLIINKKGCENEISLAIPGFFLDGKNAQTYIFTGTDPSDLYPTFRQSCDYMLGDKYILQPYSLTVFDWNK